MRALKRFARASVFALAAAAGATQAQTIGTEAWYAVPDARGVQLVHIECGPDFIDPREIVVEPGRPVELSLRSSDPDDELASTFAAAVPIGNKPTRHRIDVPPSLGRHAISCKKKGADDRDTHPRKKGLLHVKRKEDRP